VGARQKQIQNYSISIFPETEPDNCHREKKFPEDEFMLKNYKVHAK
jgi:hypothetical protein